MIHENALYLSILHKRQFKDALNNNGNRHERRIA